MGTRRSPLLSLLLGLGLGRLVLQVVVVEVLVPLRVETVLHDGLLGPVVRDPVTERVELRTEGLVDLVDLLLRNYDGSIVLVAGVLLDDVQHVVGSLVK